ncbi:MAG: tRNA pseudouridine(55) synthase TruB [Planctomycetia bacterium]|nr:tRNA pseudouridine(55) synthase TruB [Planctomycetia bacterium]
MAHFGILNVNKPPGLSSRTVVDDVLRVVGRDVKAGHAGTLDPLASGVLVICLGPATRLIECVQRMPKCYHGTFILGRTSDTEDVEGVVTELANAPVPDRAAIEAAAASMVGTIQQRPPAYSALKVAGRRAYKLARQGRAPDLAPRPVTIHSMEVIEYDYPRLTLDIRCGSGTYVRSLGRDLAEQLGSGAVMAELVRTEIGSFLLGDACQVSNLTADNLHEHLLPPTRAVENLPVVRLSAEEVDRIARGQPIVYPLNRGDAASQTAAPTEFAGIDEAGTLIALLSPRGEDELRPMRVFLGEQ